MRLSTSDINIIKLSIQKYIENAKIVLFGSRVYDDKKGGDIDILIESNHIIHLKEKIKILADIEINGIARKVDLLFQTPKNKNESIFVSARKEGIVL